jgi:hypothetical protein
MGEAAGIAAAMAVESGIEPRTVSVPELQRRLKDGGAYIGEHVEERHAKTER